MYVISNLCPMDRPSGYGFCVHLSPQWKGLVAKSEITHEHVQNAIRNLGRTWLDASGWGRLDKTESQTRRVFAYDSIRVRWGEWGIENLDVPGNACGLDIDRDGSFTMFDDGAVLVPHNVDDWRQVQLMLIVYCYFAESVVIQSRSLRTV